MPTEIYVVHPGVGLSRSSDGVAGVVQPGTNFVFSEKQFVKDGATDHIDFVQGIVVPPALDLAGFITFRLVLRQTLPGVGDVVFDVLTRNIAAGTNRDGAALTAIGQKTIVLPGSVGAEIEETFTLATAGITSGEELLIAVKRVSTDGADTYGDKIGWVRLNIEFPQTGGGGGSDSVLVFRPGGVAGGNVYTSWDALYTAKLALEGPVILQVDDSLGVASISGAMAPYDLSQTTIVGKDLSAGVASLLLVSATLSRLPDCIGRGLAFVNTLGAPAYTTIATGERFIIEPLGAIGATGGAPIIEVAAGHGFSLDLLGSVSLSTPGTVNIGVGSTVTLRAFATAFSQALIGSGGFSTTDASGTLAVEMESTSAVVFDPTTFAGFTGIFTRTLLNLSDYSSYDPTISGLVSTNVKEAIDEINAAAAVGQWTNAGAYLRPTLGAGHDVSVGTVAGKLTTEKLRVEGDLRVSGYVILNNTHPEGGGAELRIGGGSVNPGDGTGWGKGSLFTRDDTGKLYVNTGTAASVAWVVAGTQSA